MRVGAAGAVLLLLCADVLGQSGEGQVDAPCMASAVCAEGYYCQVENQACAPCVHCVPHTVGGPLPLAMEGTCDRPCPEAAPSGDRGAGLIAAYVFAGLFAVAMVASVVFYTRLRKAEGEATVNLMEGQSESIYAEAYLDADDDGDVKVYESRRVAGRTGRRTAAPGPPTLNVAWDGYADDGAGFEGETHEIGSGNTRI